MPKIAAMVRTVLRGALSRYFAPLHNTEICLHMRAYSKIGMKSTQQLQWDCLLISVVPDGKDGDRIHFEKFSLNFSKFSYPSLKQNQNCTMDYSSSKDLIDVLILNFEVMFSARVKVRKKDFCIVLTGKPQKCRDWAPLSISGRALWSSLFRVCWKIPFRLIWFINVSSYKFT